MEYIFEWNLPHWVQQASNIILLWLGFSFLVGMLAQIIVPVKRSRRSLVASLSTLVIGLTGSSLGALLVSSFYSDVEFNPVGLGGLGVSITISVLLLIAFHIYMAVFLSKEPPEKK